MIVTMQDYTITDRAPVLIGYEGENLSRNFTVKTFDDLSGIASFELLIGDVNCGAMTGNDTEITISLDSFMIGKAGYKKAQLIMLDDTGAVVMKSNQFDVLVGASNNPRYYAAGEKVKTLTVSIDGRTRQIILPAGFAVSVNGDVAVDHIAFKAPASYGDFYFGAAACRVDWTGVDGTSHTNICVEKDADGNWIWALPTALTRGGEGEISFSVSYIVTDATTGAVTADWNTGLVKFYHLESAKSDDAEEDVEEETTYDRLASAIAAVQSAQASVDDVNAILAGITSATPTVVETVADLNSLDTSKVKLAIVAADGYLHYYDGTAWKSGFAYGGLQEVIAARTDSDGVTYADLKTRLNTAEAQIKEDLSALNAGDYAYITDYIEGYYINNSGATVDVNKPVKYASLKYCIIPTSEGDEFYISLNSGTAARAYSFIDANSNVLEAAEVGARFTNAKIIAPSGSVTLIINRDNREDAYVARVSKLIDWLKELQSNVNTVRKNPIFKTSETYNLVDYVDMLYEKAYWHGTTIEGGSYTYNTNRHTIVGVLPVESGQIVTSSKHIHVIDFFDVDKTYISQIVSATQKPYEVFLVPDSAHYMKPQWSSYEYIGKSGVKTGELADICVVQKYGAKSIRYALKPKTQINGRYVSDDIFDVANPAENSNLDIIYKCREIKRQNRERGAVRLATFNIYGAMIRYVNWPVVKKECTQYGIDACGFQEVADSTKWDDGTTNKYSFSQSMMGEAFKYSHVGNTDPDGVGIRILSGLEIVSGEFTPYEYTYTASGVTYNAEAGYSHAIIKIPNYHHARAWDKKISMYTCHFSTIKAQAIGMIEHLATVITADTSEYKVFVADTNCFSVDAETGEPWIWKYFKTMGLYPAATDFTKSSICYPYENWSTSNLDFIDNIFCTGNMQCINWGVVDSQDYPIAGVSGGYVSDHCMLYADMIFDFVDGFSNT